MFLPLIYYKGVSVCKESIQLLVNQGEQIIVNHTNSTDTFFIVNKSNPTNVTIGNPTPRFPLISSTNLLTSHKTESVSSDNSYPSQTNPVTALLTTLYESTVGSAESAAENDDGDNKAWIVPTLASIGSVIVAGATLYVVDQKCFGGRIGHTCWRGINTVMGGCMSGLNGLKSFCCSSGHEVSESNDLEAEHLYEEVKDYKKTENPLYQPAESTKTDNTYDYARPASLLQAQDQEAKIVIMPARKHRKKANVVYHSANGYDGQQDSSGYEVPVIPVANPEANKHTYIDVTPDS